jgi:hypothetical protein
MEVAVLFCASVSFRRPNNSSLSLACEAASAASFAIPMRAYAYTKNNGKDQYMFLESFSTNEIIGVADKSYQGNQWCC